MLKCGTSSKLIDIKDDNKMSATAVTDCTEMERGGTLFQQGSIEV